jgi:hypothetical protein
MRNGSGPQGSQPKLNPDFDAQRRFGLDQNNDGLIDLPNSQTGNFPFLRLGLPVWFFGNIHLPANYG